MTYQPDHEMKCRRMENSYKYFLGLLRQKVLFEWAYWADMKYTYLPIISFNPGLEQTTSSAPVFSKTKEWVGKYLKKSCSF
jgi:hypothetical protein